MYASSGNKHFFTKSYHRQTFQNYGQSQQKLGTILENKGFFLHRILFSERFHQFLTQKNDFESTNLEIFEEVVHNFGKSDDDMI